MAGAGTSLGSTRTPNGTIDCHGVSGDDAVDPQDVPLFRNTSTLPLNATTNRPSPGHPQISPGDPASVLTSASPSRVRTSPGSNITFNMSSAPGESGGSRRSTPGNSLNPTACGATATGPSPAAAQPS